MFSVTFIVSDTVPATPLLEETVHHSILVGIAIFHFLLVSKVKVFSSLFEVKQIPSSKYPSLSPKGINIVSTSWLSSSLESLTGLSSPQPINTRSAYTMLLINTI